MEVKVIGLEIKFINIYGVSFYEGQAIRFFASL